MIGNSRGFIFLFSLCMLLIISVLTLAGMQHVLLYYQAINKVEQHHKDFYALENLALRLSQTNRNTSPCVVHSDEPNTIITRLGIDAHCSLSLNNTQYHYLIEDLGLFPCLIIETHVPNASHHWRISIMAVDPEHNQSVLQMRIIHPDGLAACSARVQNIKAGMSSWRYLSDAKIAAIFRQVP